MMSEKKKLKNDKKENSMWMWQQISLKFIVLIKFSEFYTFLFMNHQKFNKFFINDEKD